MKTLEAKPFDQNAENWKRENRLFISTVLEAGASGQNRIGTHALRSHRTVWFVFDAQTIVSCQKLTLLVTKGFSSPNDTTKPRKNCENGGFSTPLTGMKSCTVAAVRQRPRTPRNWRCSVAFFETFLWHFNKKQRAEVIFRLSRPVSCKNQENGSGKRWSLHASLKKSANSQLQQPKRNMLHAARSAGEKAWRRGENVWACRATLGLEKFARAGSPWYPRKKEVRKRRCRFHERTRSHPVEFYSSQTLSTANARAHRSILGHDAIDYTRVSKFFSVNRSNRQTLSLNGQQPQ